MRRASRIKSEQQIFRRTMVSKMRRIGYGLAATFCLVLQGCTGIPEGIEPVTGFDQERYLGAWYEIARLDHSFERGLSEVTATYSTNPDGSIAVLNRGFDQEEGRWREAEGVARFVDSPTVAHLKVSFFGPFYGSYIVFGLGENYDYAFVSGFNRDYLWLLSRSPEISDTLRNEFLETITDLGFAADDLVWL
jgi:apolipoprotein D and lipocalin family protein